MWHSLVTVELPRRPFPWHSQKTHGTPGFEMSLPVTKLWLAVVILTQTDQIFLVLY